MLLFYLAALFYFENVFVLETVLHIISFSYVALLSKLAFKQILAKPCVKTKETPYIFNSTVIDLVNEHTTECITVA